MKRDLLNRVITAVALVALAVTLGVWLTRSPLTATQAAAPVVSPLPPPAKPRPAEALPEPTLAPVPPPVPTPSHTTTTEVEISYEIAPPAKTEKPAAKPAETPKANHQPSGRRSWFRRR